MPDDLDLPEGTAPAVAGPSEEEYRRLVRSRFTEVEIDLILDLISRVPIAVWAASGAAQDYAVRLWSPGAEQLYGYRREDILGKNYIDTFVNPLERARAVADHRVTDDTQKPYRNLARDAREDKKTRLMLTQGVPLWHPVLREAMQGEIAVDATEVPGKDRDWLEQVLTPESVRGLLEQFIAMTEAAFVSIEAVATVANTLMELFLGSSASCVVFVARRATQLAPVGDASRRESEFDPRAVIRWCMDTGVASLIVDYQARMPPESRRSRHAARFPKRLLPLMPPPPFAVGLVRDDANRPRGGVFVHLDAGDTFSELTDGVLAAVTGSVKLALALEEKIAQAQREVDLAVKERERQAITRLARQYRHAVLKKAPLLEWYAGLLQEPRAPEALERIGDALRSMARSIVATGEAFETNLSPEPFSLGDVLSSITGAVIHAYPDIHLSRDTFPGVVMRGIRPFIEGAFENLLLNAVEAQDFAGQVGVWCAVRGGGRRTRVQAEVYICDNGPGIASEIAAGIEEGQPISTKGAGRGLGLVIARQSLAECEGTFEILATPQPPWRGACVRVRIPVDRAPQGGA